MVNLPICPFQSTRLKVVGIKPQCVIVPQFKVNQHQSTIQIAMGLGSQELSSFSNWQSKHTLKHQTTKQKKPTRAKAYALQFISPCHPNKQQDDLQSLAKCLTVKFHIYDNGLTTVHYVSYCVCSTKEICLNMKSPTSHNCAATRPVTYRLCKNLEPHRISLHFVRKIGNSLLKHANIHEKTTYKVKTEFVHLQLYCIMGKHLVGAKMLSQSCQTLLNLAFVIDSTKGMGTADVFL